jgi:transposase-like protein
MAKQFTVTDFFKRFPDDESCLEHLMKIRYGFEIDCPKCGKHGNFSRIKKQPAYQCAWCGHHVHPMAGTPFERSRTPLQKWFYAMYLFTTSRHGVPAKELQRQLGVTYKTAWRMGHEIRKYMANTDGDDGLSGHVEIDETYIGGKDNFTGRPSTYSKKTAVFGMVERGGKLMTHVVPNARSATLLPLVGSHVLPGSRISSDDHGPYRRLKALGYDHGYVRHKYREWVKGDTHTNGIENVWSRLKNSIRGTHVHVSRKHLPKYLGEFEYRYNMRHNPSAMFSRLLLSF